MKPPMLSLHAIRSGARAIARWPRAKGRGLDRALRERIILHVSAINACDVCTAVHQRSARRIGLDDRDIDAACTLDLSPRDPRTRAALRYAELRTLGIERAHRVDVDRFESMFSADERAAVRATVDLFTFNNRFNNTWTRALRALGLRRG
jgi:AhpD family alkylhydroperoxidase